MRGVPGADPASGQAFKRLSGQTALTEESVKEALREVRVALLEADVSFGVARDFVAGVREKALGLPASPGLTPAQQVVKIVHDELVQLLGGEARELNLAGRPIATVMVMGLQVKRSGCWKITRN